MVWGERITICTVLSRLKRVSAHTAVDRTRRSINTCDTHKKEGIFYSWTRPVYITWRRLPVNKPRRQSHFFLPYHLSLSMNATQMPELGESNPKPNFNKFKNPNNHKREDIQEIIYKTPLHGKKKGRESLYASHFPHRIQLHQNRISRKE